MQHYEPIIGLEVHVELATKSKMFCGCPADHFGQEPNTQTCPVCLGLPGALPVPNRKAVEWTIMLGLALNCEIPPESKFDRKNYFYPDLPKGYQISQYDMPLAINGELELRTQNLMTKKIRIRRVHLEEDTGKLLHAVVEGEPVSLIDFNRSGVPLVEIVTEPDFRAIEEVDIFLKKLQQLIRYLGISGADMEKGSMRIEPSVSLQGVSTEKSRPGLEEVELPGYRVELKNINSFRFVRKALEYEIKRQTEMMEAGEMPVQQTRGWNEGKGATIAQREKEEAHDYRYFPEPDIPPMKWEKSQISNLKSQIPELPDVKKERFIRNYSLGDYDASILVETCEKADYFEEAVRAAKAVRSGVTPKIMANWLINRHIKIDEVLPAQLVERIIKATQVATISDDELEKIIKQAIANNPRAIEDYKKGKEQTLMFLVGQVRKVVGNKGNIAEIAIKMRDIIKRFEVGT